MSDRVSDTRWSEADGILDEALDRPADQRHAFISERCAGDLELRALVERLLERCDEGDTQLTAGGALGGAFADSLGRELEAGSTDPTGTVIGRYRVLSELGRGGMAVVHLAERADDEFHQLVALKLLQSGADSEHMLERFHQERQILAVARHPNIAQLLDAGFTDDGRSFIAMEYVDGEPIDRYCDDRKLGVNQRLRLFLKVAQAVDYAHRNLVVHRDIKPSNILVTADGDVKLLDFGIAKLLDDTGNELTRTHMRAMTPAFASPEQIDGGPITTATDVYQLGMLLYLLLAGTWPYPAETGSEAAMMLAIRSEPAARPSTSVGGRGGGAVFPGGPEITTAEIAAARATQPTRLRRVLSGDIDTIILTCLRKEPDRRYPSVAQLISDIRRSLDGRTISARPDTFSYRLKTFVRRHSAATATAAASAVVVVGLVGFYTVQVGIQRDRARLEASKASEVAAFLTGLFQVSAPTRSMGEAVTARELLDRGADRIDDDLADQPELQATMMTLIGDVYRELALYDEAEELLTRAVTIRRDHPGDDNLDLGDSLFALGRVYERQRDIEPAREFIEEALAIREAAHGPIHPDVANARDALGLVARYDGDFAGARALHEEAAEVFRVTVGTDHADYGLALNRLAVVVQDQREYAESVPIFEEAIEVLESTVGMDHPYTAAAKFNFAGSLRYNGEIDRADATYTEVLPLIAKAFGPEHPAVGMVYNNHSNLLRNEGRYDEAEEKLHLAHEIWAAAYGPDHPQVGWIYNNLGLIERFRGNHEAARDYFQEAVDIGIAAYGPDHAEVATQLKNLGGELHALGRSVEAIELMERAVVIRERVYGVDHSYVGTTLRELARVQMDIGRHEDAIADFERAIELGRDDPDYRDDEITEPTIDLARCLVVVGRSDEAEALLLAERDACLDSSRPAVDEALTEIPGRSPASAAEAG